MELPVSSRKILAAKHLLHLAYFPLDLAADLLAGAFILCPWIARRAAKLFFHFAFRFLKSTLDFILCARFHKNKIAHYGFSGCENPQLRSSLNWNWPVVLLDSRQQTE